MSASRENTVDRQGQIGFRQEQVGGKPAGQTPRQRDQDTRPNSCSLQKFHFASEAADSGLWTVDRGLWTNHASPRCMSIVRVKRELT